MCYNSLYSCPVCNEQLVVNGKNYRCKNNHSFDCAKSGYINLLTSDRMNTKNPGDNKLMVRSRSEFLDKDYYLHLKSTLCLAVSEVAEENSVILDAGCGEGYYTDGIFNSISEKYPDVKVAGIDISKFAADKAAKRNKKIEFAVASVFHMPFPDNSCDVLINVFAPFCRDEYMRVLKNGGYMIMAIPDRLHLWELKKAVYDTPYENKPENEEIEGFEFIRKYSSKKNIVLNSNEDIMNLFAMTPYFYNTTAKDREKLSDISYLETQTEFIVLVYRKKEI